MGWVPPLPPRPPARGRSEASDAEYYRRKERELLEEGRIRMHKEDRKAFVYGVIFVLALAGFAALAILR